MKQNIPIIYMTTTTLQRVRTAVLAAFLMLAGLLPVGCADELDIQSPSDPACPAAGAPVHFTVTDGGYASASPGTRAVDVGYTTRFVKGDTIGLYIITEKNGKQWRTQSNTPLIFNGTEWEVAPTSSTTVTDYISTDSVQSHYYVYSPFQRNKGIANSYSPNATARKFFKRGIDSWKPRLDQSTPQAYAASDLMVAKGEVTPRTDGDGYTVTFRMEHQMVLAVVNVPGQEYIDDSNGTERRYQHYRGLSLDNGGAEGAFLLNDPSTGRYLVNPGTPCSVTYYDSNLNKHSFDLVTNADNPGSYVRYVVDNADAPATPTNRALRVGDFYMQDEGIIPREYIEAHHPTLPADQCLGLVLSTNDPTQDDDFLRRDHPTCNHGTVIACTDASFSAPYWSLTQETVNNWTNSADRGENQVNILYTAEPLPKKGYAHTYALRLYNNSHSNKRVQPVSLIDRNAAPLKSSGWYLPAGELADIQSLSDMNSLFQAAGGTKMEESSAYWLSIEFNAQEAWLYKCIDGTHTTSIKTGANRLRAILAF